MKRDTDHLTGVAADVHHSPIHPPQDPENEISVIDLWLVLARRRYWVMTIFVISVGAAIAVSLLMSPRYESRAVLSLGQVSGPGDLERSSVLEQPDILLERLKRMYQLEKPERNDRTLPFMESIEMDTGASKRIFKFKALGRTPEEARDFLQKSVDGLVASHRKLYEEALQVQHDRIAGLGANLTRLEHEGDLLRAQRQHSKLGDGSEAAIVTLERARLVVSEAALEKDRLNLQLALMPLRTQPTQLLLEPTLPKDALHPRPVLYTVFGVTAGLILGVFAAFAVEFLVNTRKEVAIRRQSGHVS